MHLELLRKTEYVMTDFSIFLLTYLVFKANFHRFSILFNKSQIFFRNPKVWDILSNLVFQQYTCGGNALIDLQHSYHAQLPILGKQTFPPIFLREHLAQSEFEFRWELGLPRNLESVVSISGLLASFKAFFLHIHLCVHNFLQLYPVMLVRLWYHWLLLCLFNRRMQSWRIH